MPLKSPNTPSVLKKGKQKENLRLTTQIIIIEEIHFYFYLINSRTITV